jgi:hypothetical protein
VACAPLQSPTHAAADRGRLRRLTSAAQPLFLWVRQCRQRPDGCCCPGDAVPKTPLPGCAREGRRAADPCPSGALCFPEFRTLDDGCGHDGTCMYACSRTGTTEGCLLVSIRRSHVVRLCQAKCVCVCVCVCEYITHICMSGQVSARQLCVYRYAYVCVCVQSCVNIHILMLDLLLSMHTHAHAYTRIHAPVRSHAGLLENCAKYRVHSTFKVPRSQHI